jgi:isopenicillin-N epimerase
MQDGSFLPKDRLHKTSYTPSLFERRMQWQGTRDISAWLTVPAALDFQAKHDWPQVQKRCHELAKLALDVLTKRFGTHPIARDDDWAQMVAIPVAPQDPDLLRKRLYEESHIEVPVTSHGNEVFVRVRARSRRSQMSAFSR